MTKLIIACIIILLVSGCTGVDGNLLDVGYEPGVVDGCMLTIFAIAPEGSLPPYAEAYEFCADMATSLEEDGYGATNVFFPLPAQYDVEPNL